MSDESIEIFEENGVRVEINSPYILNDLYKAFDKYIFALEAQLTKEIGKEQFDWPQATFRGKHRSKKNRDENTQRVGSPRDIVDSGFFRESISVSRPAQGKARFVWNAPYSRYILKGYSTKHGNWPARDWIAKALKALPPARIIKKNLKDVQAT
ncbi:MAG: hypothetical protein GY905_14790 [Gammaproteobacteria bacterium]|nr:hypothetical protein [Gammaproteobacteria bacterium]